MPSSHCHSETRELPIQSIAACKKVNTFEVKCVVISYNKLLHVVVGDDVLEDLLHHRKCHTLNLFADNVAKCLSLQV